MLKITTTQLEDNWVSFVYEGILDSTEKFKWQQQFFDGALHKIEVEVTPEVKAVQQFQPLQVAQTLSVKGVAPPLAVRLISLAYRKDGFKAPSLQRGFLLIILVARINV